MDLKRKTKVWTIPACWWWNAKVAVSSSSLHFASNLSWHCENGGQNQLHPVGHIPKGVSIFLGGAGFVHQHQLVLVLAVPDMLCVNRCPATKRLWTFSAMQCICAWGIVPEVVAGWIRTMDPFQTPALKNWDYIEETHENKIYPWKPILFLAKNGIQNFAPRAPHLSSSSFWSRRPLEWLLDLRRCTQPDAEQPADNQVKQPSWASGRTSYAISSLPSKGNLEARCLHDVCRSHLMVTGNCQEASDHWVKSS